MSVPVDPGDFPPGDNPPPGQLPGLGALLRKRYTSNIAVTEEMAAIDLLHEVIFLSSRMYLTQSETGKIALKSKKPVPYAYGTEQFNAAETALDVDSVTDWIGDTDTLLLVAPHTTSSELQTVTGAVYPTSQNSITLSSTGGLFSITAFSGCDGASTPATGSIQVTGLGSAPVTCSITLESTVFNFITSTSDTVNSIASYIGASIRSHPAVNRRFDVSVATDTVTLVAKFGTLTVSPGLTYTTSIPLPDPTAALTITAAAGSTALAAGVYKVAYSDVNALGETLLSPYKSVTLTAGQKISVSALTLATNATSRNWYVSPEAGSTKLRYHSNTNGSAFDITTLPLLTDGFPPDLNTSSCEVMKVSAAFSDRASTRSGTTASNVQKASFSWFLGNREDTVNEIQLKYRNADADWQLITLKLKDAVSIAKIKTIKSKEFNGQAIDNTDQAYRIAAGLLAELRDADFFYKWKANREALLLQEGDVVTITDDGSGVYNLPVRIEQIEFDVSGIPSASFTARVYASTLYDDSIVERPITLVSEAAV